MRAETDAGGDLLLRLPWAATTFYGQNEVTAAAVDDNLYDFLHSLDAFSMVPGTDGEPGRSRRGRARHLRQYGRGADTRLRSAAALSVAPTDAPPPHLRIDTYVMPIALRHREDPLPPWPPFPGLAVRRVFDAAFMARLQERPESEMARRFSDGHRAYVAWRDGTPAAWGWVATRSAEIGEVETTFVVPSGARYLWNFVTLGAHRGLGIYPRLLDAIVRAESAEAEEFWVAYAPENHASGSGIRKAGFTRVADLAFDLAGHPVVRVHAPGEGDAAARMIGLTGVERTVAPCWRCVRSKGPADRACVSGRCTCDYQQPRVACG